MIWSSLILTTALLSQSNGLFDSESLEAGDEPYWVGDGYNVTWTADVLDSDVVNVVLRYGPNLESEWTIISDQPNTAMEPYKLIVGEDLSDSVGQLLITNGTMGQFRLEIPSYINNSNITSRSYNLSNVVPCYQTVVISTVQGQVVKAGERISFDDVRVFVRKETYLNVIGADRARWIADFVNVNTENLTWTLADSLGLASGPTQAPTRVPTMMPTVNNTNGNGTNGSSPIAVASLTGGSTKSSNGGNTATTPSPTTVYTTGKRQGHGRRLMQSLSLRDVTLGLGSNNNNNDDNYELGCDRFTTGTWCEFSLKLTIPASAQPGGPFFFVVGIRDENDTTAPLQYYGVNGNGGALDTANQFVVYNASNLAVDLDYTFMNESLFYKYENVGMNVSLGDNVTDPEVYVALWNPATDAYYYLECEAHMPSYYTSFGWRTTGEDMINHTLPSGGYQFELYWGAVPFIEAIARFDLYRFEDVGTLPFVQITNEFNGTSAAAVTIDKNKFNKGKNAKVLFETSFNAGVNLTGYIQQCDYTQQNYSMNDTGPCHDYTDSMFSFTYTPGEKVTVSFPKNLYKTSLKKNETVTNLIISADLCSGDNELATIIPVTISSSSSSTTGLSAGAIVGIVCAGVLVLGLAAWWLCMKKGGGDQYRELEG